MLVSILQLLVSKLNFVRILVPVMCQSRFISYCIKKNDKVEIGSI